MEKQLTDSLNGLVANLTVFYMKLHHFHWFVEGPNFFILHEKFEELYDEVTEHVDAVAERLLQVKEKPISTLKACLENAEIEEAETISSDQEMVQDVIDDLEKMNQQVYKGIELAQDAGDEATNDLLVGISSSFEKHIWMFRAFLGKTF